MNPPGDSPVQEKEGETSMKLVKLIDERLEEFLMVALLFVMAVLMIVQVVCRYCFHQSLTWSEELVRFLFIWAGFISISYCVKKSISIKITQFEALLPEKLADSIDIVRNTILLAFCLYMVPFSLRYLQQCMHNGSTSPAMGIPMTLVQAAPLVGFLMVSVRLFQYILLAIHNLRKGGRMF